MKAELKDHIYVFGHQSPDTDSVCASISYAYLKQQLGADAHPYRLGKINKETAFVLESAGVEEPAYLKDIKVKLKDLDMFDPKTLRPSDPLSKAWEQLVNNKDPDARLVPVTDNKKQILGLISLEDITKSFMTSFTEEIMRDNEISFDNLLHVLSGELVSGKYNYETIQGTFFVGSDEPDSNKLSDKDIIITGTRENVERFAFKEPCGCVIAANNVDITGLTGSKTAIVKVDNTIIRIISTLYQAISVSSVMKKDNFVFLYEDRNIDDIVDTMRTSSHRNFPVVNEKEILTGIISRRHLMLTPAEESYFSGS